MKKYILLSLLLLTGCDFLKQPPFTHEYDSQFYVGEKVIVNDIGLGPNSIHTITALSKDHKYIALDNEVDLARLDFIQFIYPYDTVMEK